MERIVSCGQVTPDDYWYDNETDEFVMLLQGNATILKSLISFLFTDNAGVNTLMVFFDITLAKLI